MKQKRFLIAFALGAALSGTSACTSAVEDGEGSSESTTSTVVAASDWAYDIENDYMVAGAADTVIVGTVVSQIEPSASRQEPNPETQFQVEVVSVLKGQPADVITVSQLGGYYAEENIVVMSGDDPLMGVGDSYVMALVFDPAVNWYTASPATNGIEQIPTDEAEGLDPNGAQRRGGPPEPQAVSDMREAVANQQVPSAPVGEGE